jgi:hypothetical protein
MNTPKLLRRMKNFRMEWATAVIGMLAIAAACVQAPAPQTKSSKAPIETIRTASSLEVNGEVARLQAAMAREVPDLIVDTPESERAWIVRTQATIAASDLKIRRPQLVVVVDRNPEFQQLRLVLVESDANWMSLGGTKVSTGQTGRRDYYVTPTGVFLHTDAILDWRAEGTFNARHIRGLGVKGMRVWDFGWQTAAKGWGSGETGEIRLLLHATDPDYLERRLGHSASKGCVRIPAAMNRFLDRHGVLDTDYERAATEDPRFAALLLPDRVPTPLAGDALVIVDSSEHVSAAVQRSLTTHPGDGQSTMGGSSVDLRPVEFGSSVGCS